MGHHHAISTDIQYKVNYAIYTFQDCGYIILLFVGGAVVGELGLLSLSNLEAIRSKTKNIAEKVTFFELSTSFY